MSAAAFADRVIDAMRSHVPLDAGPEPRSRAEGFEVQRLLCERLGEKVAGWKVAVHPVLGPVAAPIFAGTMRGDGGAWPMRPGLGVEIEIALWLSRDLPRGVYDRAAIAAAVGGACVGVELVGTRLREPTRNLEAFLGDLMSNVGYVAPDARWRWADQPIAGRRCRLLLDGEALFDAPAAPPALDPLAVTAAWLAAGDDALGGFKAGQFVTTGSLCGAVPLPGKGRATALLEGFDPIEVVID